MTAPFTNRKANLGMTLFLGVILFNIIMYFVIYTANADETMSPIGSGGTTYNSINSNTTEDMTTAKATTWASGFNVSVFSMPWWVNIFYVTFQAILIGLAIYALIRGLA